MITAVYTGHAPVRGHLFTTGLFEGDPICRCCGIETETVQHIVCRCEALARQRYDVFGKLIIEPKDISTASIRELRFFIRSAGLLRLLKVILGQHNKPKAAVHSAEMTGPLMRKKKSHRPGIKTPVSLKD
jgi:hypothetical protein